MYTINIVIAGIITVKMVIRKVYKSSRMQALDFFFMLNLEILSATLYYLKGKGSNDGDICKKITASISLNFVAFAGIVAYHTQLQIKKTRWYLSVQNVFLTKWQKPQHFNRPLNSATVDHTHTVSRVDIREILLESEN